VQAVGQEGHENMRLNPVLPLMVEGAQGQVAFEVLKGLL
jgi:hypothetical protein